MSENRDDWTVGLSAAELRVQRPNYAMYILLLLAGLGILPTCNYIIDKFDGDGKVVIVKGDDAPAPTPSALAKVREEFNKIESKEDKLTIYKLFAGGGDYLSIAEFKGSSSQFDPLLAKVQASYNWSREKYPSFTDAVSAYLDEVDYDEPKNIETDSDRAAFAKIFKDLAEALK